VESGTLNIASGGTLTGGEFTAASGDSINLSGGTFTTSGTVSFTGAGTAIVSGATVNNSNGALSLQIETTAFGRGRD
jgi:hypothetical protein